jgi:hypothetical protein
MRNLLSKATVGAMIAGAALTVAACGGEATTNTTNATDMGNDMSMDANMTDMSMDANMTDMNAVDMNATTDMNATDMNASNGM